MGFQHLDLDGVGGNRDELIQCKEQHWTEKEVVEERFLSTGISVIISHENFVNLQIAIYKENASAENLFGDYCY